MDKVPFIKSVHCLSRAHCDFCRNNAEFRRSLLKSGLVEIEDFGCPQGWAINSKVPDLREPVDKVPALATDMKIEGPKHWKQWHALADQGIFPGNDPLLLIRSLPCGECRRHALAAFEKVPFRPDDQSRWMVDYHNEINATLGKPQFKIDTSSQIE